MAMDYFLKQINPANDATPLKLFLDKNEIIIGRRSIISLTGFNKVSRKHAKFLNKNGRWFVCDLESLNKLYVNFKEVSNEWTPLEIGDIIGFGTPSYIEDGGLVCVFAAKHRIKQEVTDEIECPYFGTKNTENVQNFSRVKDDKSLKVKQELSPCKNEDFQMETVISKPECILQTDASESSSVLNNTANITKVISGSVTDQNNVIVPQSKHASNSLKPVIKTEPNGIDDGELFSIKKTSSYENLLINQKLDVGNINTCDKSGTTTCEVKFSLENNIEDMKESLCKDVPSNIRKANMPFTEYCKEVIEKNDFIPENKILKNSDKLQTEKSENCHKTKDVKPFFKKMKNCSVRLVRCDSKYFQWPPEINYYRLFASVEKRRHFSEQSIPQTFQDSEKIEMNCSESSGKQNFICHQKSKNLEDDIQESKNTVKYPLKLKINKNRILSSSSEMSSDESECEKKDGNISNNIPSDKICNKIKSKKQTGNKKSLHLSRRNNGSLDESSQELKVSKKRKQNITEHHSKRRKKRKKGCDNQSDLNDSEYLFLNPSAIASSKEADIRNSEISRYSRDESSFCVERDGCSKYWTPEYNEFETGEVQERLKSNRFIKTKPTAGRILLTDPKPIEYRPRRLRGREEWFKEQTSYSCRDSDQNEGVSENVDEETSHPSKKISKLSSSQRYISSKEQSFVVNRKFSTVLCSNTTITSSKGNISVAAEALPASGGIFLTDVRKNSTELFSSEALPTARENFENAARKNSTEQFSSETLAASSGNSSIVSQRNSVDLISSESVPLSRENSCMESRVKSMQHKSDNSALTKSTAVTIQMNTVTSVPRTRNSSGCRTRFLVEIHTNEVETSKNKGPTPIETFSQCSEKRDCSTSIIVNPTKNINVSGFPTVEATNREEKNSEKMNNTVASVSPNRRTVSLPEPIPTSSFENKKQLNWRDRKTVGESELSAHKASDTSEIESNLTKTIFKKSDTQFLPKEVFSKNDKNSNDKKVAVVTPNKKLDQPDTISVPYFHNSVKETITNRVHSTYILSPVKTFSKPIQTNLDSTSVEDLTGSTCEDSKDAKFRSRYLIKNIVQWNPKWLEEQAKNKKPPPVISKGGSVLPLRFSSYDTYIKSFYPMISLEIWESLFRESKPFWLRKEVKNTFYFKVTSNNLKHSLTELQCESIVNENLSFLPYEGNIILLGFNEFGNGLENSLLGYIHRHKIESSREIEKMKGWQNVPEEWQENAMLWTFSVYIKKSKRNFPNGSVGLAYGILNTKHKLQLADALGEFKDSPIQNDILRPTKEMFTFCKSISKIPRPQLIQTVSEEIKKENPHSKLILINAPVATGKTGAIIGIVEKLLFSNTSRMKLLLCALSDLTVDEIGLRLVELNERCSWRGNSIKFVRFGLSENVPAKLQAYTLERKVLKMFKEQNKKEFQEREKELKILEDKINDVLFKEQLKNNDKYRFRKSNDEALKHLMDQLQSLKENSPYKNIDPVIHAKYESAILNESDVVVTTLNSCMHPQMRKFFKSCKEESHACCIIDETSECTELEVLQCLHPEINRLVLVGDLQQLQPTVSSKYAVKWGFKRSMMERILKLFSVQFSSTPPLSMSEQHRMQSQICHFPSKYFYQEQLLTATTVDERYKYSPLKPYVVYDILEREMPNPSVNIAHSEPFIIANICAQLLQAVPTASLGVIVACEDLAAIYRIPLSQGNAALKEIEVNTVENYQGIERDIIIVSCINPSLFAESDNFLSSEKKMNVAITRARQSLVICGHVSSMTQFKHWAALINDAKQRKNFISVSSLRQIPFVIMKSICRMG